MISESLPTKLDLRHFKQDTFSRSFVFDTNTFNFTNYTCVMKIYQDSNNTTALVTPTVVISGGTVSVTAAASLFTNISSGTYDWELKFTLPDGSTQTWLIGYFELCKGSNTSASTDTVNVYTGTNTVAVTVTAMPSALSWGYGNDAAMAIKDTELTASGALAGSYMFFNTTSNSPYFWNGSNFV